MKITSIDGAGKSDPYAAMVRDELDRIASQMKVITAQAEFNRKKFDALTTVGFTPEQAMQLIIGRF